jgi:hypothetical protein
MVEQPQAENKFRHPIPEQSRAHLRAARREIRRSIVSLLPQGFVEHSNKARKEMLLAWRSMIDAAIERLDEEEKEA